MKNIVKSRKKFCSCNVLPVSVKFKFPFLQNVDKIPLPFSSNFHKTKRIFAINENEIILLIRLLEGEIINKRRRQKLFDIRLWPTKTLPFCYLLHPLGSGLEKTRVFLKKPSPVGFFGFFWVFLGFLGFFGFFWVFLPGREGF